MYMKILCLMVCLAALAFIISLLANVLTSNVAKHQRQVQHNLNRYHRKAFLRLISAVIISPVRYIYNYIRNTRLLDSYSWYRALSGNWTDSHGMNTLTPKEICRLSPVDFKRTYFGE